MSTLNRPGGSARNIRPTRLALGALSLLAIYEEVRVYRIRLESKKGEELLQIVTENAADMVELIILLAHKLKLKIRAQGIESAKHWERLCELGCDLGQRYFFSQPVELEAAGRLLSGLSHLPHASKAAA